MTAKVQTAGASATSSDATHASEGAIQRLLAALEAAGLDDAAFADALAKVADRSVRKAWAIAVAAQFTGLTTPPWRTKAAALTAIRERYDERVYRATKRKEVGSARPW